MALFRPPNFLTVPGDVLAGYLLAGGAGFVAAGASAVLTLELFAVVAAGILFYAAGLLLNDWADAGVDRLERPERPVPSGLVSRMAVFVVAGALLLTGVGACYWLGRPAFLVGVVLAVAITNYNLLTKNIPLIGALNMGFCRGLNFLLGATVTSGLVWSELVWWGGGTLVAYIAAVTHLARREMSGRYFLIERWLPACVLVVAFFSYLPLSELIDWPNQVAVVSFFFLASLGAARTAQYLPDRKGKTPGEGLGPPIPTPALIGRLIALLLPLQAALIAGSGDGLAPLVLGLAILALWPMKRWMGRLFYAS